MTSSILAGERRWTSARRGGMTVLGKVAVPKPLNLPSQRLENHGLDPSVEIVPKGTLGWGSRPSSSGSNAWGPSSVSPNADGGTGSSSQLSGRPSSGSGTRPSTAGSERSHESTPSVWGQSSRSSSASGALNSNQTALASLRPRSADTRPGSSHLSRFAESSSDNSVAWGPTGVSDKLGLGSSKNEGFSLSSGDFPTLGSEKDNCGKSIDSKDQGSYARPGSSSSRAASGKGDISSNANVESGTVNTWRRDDPQHAEDVVQPDVEKWQAETQPYLNVNIPPQQFDSWPGPPLNPPGVWYRGPPQGPPYGAPLDPGGFPVESFHYYHPQRPGDSANSQAVPASGTGPKGHHPNSRDVPRPHIPDAYFHPGMPLRPGFYPGSMACEGYYGPPMGYRNSNEQNRPFMGVAARPTLYNPYHGENAPDLGNNNARSTVHGRPDNTREPSYKVLTKHHTESDGKWLEDRREHATPNAPNVEKGFHPRASLDKNEWEFEDGKYEIHSRRTFGEDAHSKNVGSHRDSTVAGFREQKAVVDGSANKSDSAAVSVPQVSRESLASPRDPVLIQKIEFLNAKARTSGSNNQNNRIREANAKADSSASDYDRTNASVNSIPSTHDVDVYAVNKPLQPPVSVGTSISRRGGRGPQERLDIRGKSFNKQDADGRGKSQHFQANPEVSSASLNDVRGGKQFRTDESTEKSGTNMHGKDDDGGSLKTMGETTVNAAQRTKTKEIAKQRAKKLQKEEEDRIREQNEKARAKFEELNQRAQAVDVPVVENTSTSSQIQLDQEKPQIGSNYEALTSTLESGNIVVGEFTVLSREMILATSKNMNVGSAVLFGQPLSLQQDARIAGAAADCKTAPLANKDDSVPGHKHMGFKQKQGSSTDKSVQINPTEAPKPEAASSIDQSSLPRNPNVAASSQPHHGRTNRSNKNKHKPNNPSSSVKFPQEGISETSELKDSKSVQTHEALPPEQLHTLPSEEVGGKANGQWNSRRMPRQQHGKKTEKLQSNDSLIWAPVRTHSRAEVSDGTVNTAVPDVVTASGGSDSVIQKDTKGKRVDMERYVPKQGGSQSSVNQTVSDNVRWTANPSKETEGSQLGFPPSENAGPTGESRNVDGKHNKQSKPHGLWRQRGSVESQSRPDKAYSGEETKSFHDWSSSADGWNTVDNSGAAASVTPAVVDDREVSGKGHRHQPKAHGKAGNTQNVSHGNFDDGQRKFSQARVPDLGQTDKRTALKENQGAGQRTGSQWQPKSQVYSVQSQCENRPSEVVVQPAGDTVAGHQGSRREKQTSSYTRRARSPNPHSDNTLEPSYSASADTQQEQQRPSVFRKNGMRSNRFDGVHEPYGQDNRHHTASSNNERQRLDSQYEYQVVGQYGNRSRNFEGPRYKDRSQGHQSRGGRSSRGRQGATFHGDYGYN